MLKTSGYALGFQHSPRDLANVNEWKIIFDPYINEPLHQSAYAKTKAQTIFVVTAKLISAFDFASQMVQSLFFLDPKSQPSSLLLRLYRLVCVGPGLEVIKLFFQSQLS